MEQRPRYRQPRTPVRFSGSNSETIEATATASGYSTNAVASATCTIKVPFISVAVSLSSGVIYKQTVTLTATTSQSVLGGRWWITEDGFSCTANGVACGAAPNIAGGGFTQTTSPLSAGTHTFYVYYSATASVAIPLTVQ